MFEKEIKEKVNEITPQVVTWRRHFHTYPEISGEEKETSLYIQEELKKLGIPFETGFFGTAVLGTIKGEQPGKTVALRADMDALPVTEQTGLPFASKNKGKMHACGHDSHMAILLGAAAVLNQMKSQLKGQSSWSSSQPKKRQRSEAAVTSQPAASSMMSLRSMAFTYGRSSPSASSA